MILSQNGGIGVRLIRYRKKRVSYFAKQKSACNPHRRAASFEEALPERPGSSPSLAYKTILTGIDFAAGTLLSFA